MLTKTIFIISLGLTFINIVFLILFANISKELLVFVCFAIYYSLLAFYTNNFVDIDKIVYTSNGNIISQCYIEIINIHKYLRKYIRYFSLFILGFTYIFQIFLQDYIKFTMREKILYNVDLFIFGFLSLCTEYDEIICNVANCKNVEIYDYQIV